MDQQKVLKNWKVLCLQSPAKFRGEKCTALNLKTFVPYTYAEIWNMDIRPIQNTPRPLKTIWSRICMILTMVSFFQKMSTETEINFFNIVAIIFKKSIHKLQPFVVLFSIGWLMQGNDSFFIDITNVKLYERLKLKTPWFL